MPTDDLLSAMLAAAAGSQADAAARIAALTEHSGAPRLGWLVPPQPQELIGAAEAILAGYAEYPRRLCVVGTGGWAFAASAVAEASGTDRVVALDLPATAELDAVTPPFSCLSVSASGSTFETGLITDAMVARSVPVRQLRERELSARGLAEHTAMFGAPLSTAFAVPALVADPIATERAYRELSDGYLDLARDAVGVAEALDGGATVAVPTWAGAGTRLWMRQLARQALGGKPGATLNSVEFAVEFAAGSTVSLDYSEFGRDLPALVRMLYHFGVFVAALGLLQGVPICSETNVHHYKALLGSVPVDWPAGTVHTETALLGPAIADWADGTAVDIVVYRPLPAAAFADSPPPGPVWTGPRWNHHSFQSGFTDSDRKVAVVAGPATDPLAEGRRRIAVATQQSLSPRSALFALTDN